jgi:hypothetical protein
MGEMRNSYGILDGKPEGDRLLARLVVNRRIILKLVLKK